MLKDGDFTHAELMMGTNQDEGGFIYNIHNNIYKYLVMKRVYGVNIF